MFGQFLYSRGYSPWGHFDGRSQASAGKRAVKIACVAHRKNTQAPAMHLRLTRLGNRGVEPNYIVDIQNCRERLIIVCHFGTKHTNPNEAINQWGHFIRAIQTVPSLGTIIQDTSLVL